jgi:hypothetical protein
MLRGSAVAIVLATLGAAGALGATAIRERTGARRDDDRATHVRASASQAVPATAPVSAAATPQQEPARVAPVPATPAPSVTPAAAPLPIIPPGESPLQDGVRAQRNDSVVVLQFDNPEMRTRIPEKFERFVRSTLPQVYGPAADSALAHIPVGALARQGGLLDELPVRGMRVALSDGWSIVLFPETRSGQGGPLVVRYRATVTK